MARDVAAFTAVLLLAGCASSAPTGIYLPTWGSLDALPAALLEGTLLEEDGCLWIEADETRWLVLWPGGTSVVDEGGQLIVHSGAEAAVVGTRVSTGGGEYGREDYDFVVELIGEQVPAKCRQTGLYWLAGPVTPAAS